MRLWTLHPSYLDAKGLVAAWREGLLAQKVLLGKTRGYIFHPQLIRFRTAPKPAAVIASFLWSLAEEAHHRGYLFDKTKIGKQRFRGKIKETRGQLAYEWKHLKAKLKKRDSKRYQLFKNVKNPKSHPLFRMVPGRVKDWERIKK